MSEDDTNEASFTTPKGNKVTFFYNKTNGCLVIHLMDGAGFGGRELFRMDGGLDEDKLLAHLSVAYRNEHFGKWQKQGPGVPWLKGGF